MSHDHSHDHDHHYEHHHGPAELVRIGLVGLAVLLSGIGVSARLAPGSGTDVLALAATLVGGWPIFQAALEAVRHRRMTMELSMTLALGAALLIGETFTALVIVLFVLIAEALEGLTMERGRRAVDHLLGQLPDEVLVLRDGREHRMATSEIRPGETVVVRPGERIPVDGEVAAGSSFADEASITGEAAPAEKLPGSRVFAGSINQMGALEVRVDSKGDQTVFGRILEAIEKAQASRAPVQRLADRLAGYLVYFAVLCAATTFVLTRDMTATISVILVAGACGVAAGTPLALLGALGQAAGAGAIVKDGKFLEQLGLVDTVVLDKTGTLTTADARVSAVRPAPGATRQELLEAAAVAESRSEHPLAEPILARARAEGLSWTRPDEFEYTPGLGLVCRVQDDRVLAGSRRLLEQHGVDCETVPPGSDAVTEICVARNGRALGVLELDDPLREEAPSAVEHLRALGLRTVLLTGDVAIVAESVGARLGVDEVRAQLLPEEKLSHVEQLIAAGRTVAMVGDGINDAPSLAAAQVGLAMGSGTDVARQSADVVLLGNDLERVAHLIGLARRCRAIIWFNFAGTVVVDLVGIALAAFGYLTPILAVLIHVGSELAFILNSARLLPGGSRATN